MQQCFRFLNVDTEELRSFQCLRNATKAFKTGLLGLMARLTQRDALRKMHFWSSIISVYWEKKKSKLYLLSNWGLCWKKAC